jgi:hypothetical protein
MQDSLNLLLLVCASFAALVFGVFAAHAVCRTVFYLLKTHARSVAAEASLKSKPATAQI